MRKILLLLTVLTLVFSCKKENKSSIDVSNISIDLQVDRYEIDFYNTKENNLNELKEKYSFLLNHEPDSVWLGKINDKDEQELYEETIKVFKDFSEEKEQLTSLFKHVKYYNPKFYPPKVITMLTNIDYESRVIYADSLLFISLDAYLGKEHEFYGSYPKYIKQNNTKEHLIVDVANSIIEKQLFATTERTFLGKMIAAGKKMYLLDMYLPAVSDKEKAGYSEEKMAWAIANEEQIWKYFIEKDLLYSTNSNLNKRFLEIAPFSKFYLGEDNKSPGQIGGWIGWQIVRSYMQNNDVSLRELLQTDAEKIFKKSKYKPKR